MRLKKPLVFETAFSTYTADEQINQGGSGRIYHALDESGDIFAIKLLDPAKASKGRLKRFRNEIGFCSRNPHPNIVSVLDWGYHLGVGQKTIFYVMPLYACSLRTLIDDGLSHEKILPYFEQILCGVEAAHLKGVIHRDLKPENVLFDNRKDLLLVADFGIAHFKEEDLVTPVETKASDKLANFQYAAPEQRSRGQVIDQRADIFALGLILNEMFTHSIPQGPGYPMIESVQPDYAYLDRLVEQMIQHVRDQRLDSIEAVKRTLIGHRQNFVSTQRISELDKTVVPTFSSGDDPLIADPPRLINADWETGQLTLFLSRPVNEKWRRALQNMGNFSSVYGAEPSAFRISGNEAKVGMSADNVQQAIDFFKAWLPKANAVYKVMIQQEKKAADEKFRKDLERQIAEEKTRRDVLSKIRI
jgi:serine/threonine protein kinase